MQKIINYLISLKSKKPLGLSFRPMCGTKTTCKVLWFSLLSDGVVNFIVSLSLYTFRIVTKFTVKKKTRTGEGIFQLRVVERLKLKFPCYQGIQIY